MAAQELASVREPADFNVSIMLGFPPFDERGHPIVIDIGSNAAL
ncbi:MAG: hypothetical protein ACREDO_03820 [Methyloceanibacter sp.]